MDSLPSLLLVLVLCLGQTIHMQEGVLPKPCIRARPGPVILRGRPMTIVCRGPAGAELFRLEDKNGRSVYWDQRNVSQRGSHWTEATFHLDTGNEFTVGRYFCRYLKGGIWSECTEILELKAADEDVFPSPPGAPRIISSTLLIPTKPPSTAETSTSRATLEGTGLSPEHLYIPLGICVGSLLCLLLLILLLVHRQHQKKRGPPSSKDVEPRPQDRLSPAVDITESPSDVATTVDAHPEENGDMHSPSPAAGQPQEVTYAQLDQWALTQRAAREDPPQPTEPTAESSIYAALPRL